MRRPLAIAIGDPAASIAEVLDHRLLRAGARPIAVALSGGGDSVALLLAARAWAQAHGRRLLVLTLDHGLRPDRGAWTQACAARAAGLGLAFRALAWKGDKPATGLPAAARAARHRLLAQAAREAGARVILLGHTADDILEAQAMRADGASVSSPREWGPSPAWPDGRGIFLLRPMLGLRRAALRQWLAGQGETWIEDPANDDLTYARARARARLGPAATIRPALAEASASDLALATITDPAGALLIPRHRLRAVAPQALARFVSIACVCAAGTDRPPAPARVRRLAEALGGAGPLTATLGGSRITADDAQVRFSREAGRAGLPSARLEPGETCVWDGRFEIAADRAFEVRPLAGLSAALLGPEREALRVLPPDERPTLPALVDATGRAACPALVRNDGVRLESLTQTRLLAASGVVSSEPA